MKAEMKQVMYVALEFSVQERAKLAQIFIASINEMDDGDISSAWDLELKKHVQEIREDKVKGIPAEEVLLSWRRSTIYSYTFPSYISNYV